MTTLLPNSQACSQVESYEDMFKEITRKLYGEVSESQSLHTPAVAAAHIAPAVPDVERNLVMSKRVICSQFEKQFFVFRNLTQFFRFLVFRLVVIRSKWDIE